ncbi:MAG: hypothetical protein ABJB55_03410 [Actinomycetota bacterium]
MTEALSGAITATRVRLTSGIAEAEEELTQARRRCRELREEIALARARESAAATPPAPEPEVRRLEHQARIARLTDSYLSTAPMGRAIPRRWIPALATILRLDLDRFPEIFARNAILHWSGEGSMSGLHLGHAEAAAAAVAIACHIQPGSIHVQDLTGADENLDVNARVAFARAASEGRTRETTIHAVFRFDEAGKIALLYVTPDDLEIIGDLPA